jgi:hypothetical protein
MNPTPYLLAAALLLGGCAALEQPALPVVETRLGPATLAGELARVAALTPEQRRRELAALDAERRLDDARRFQQAALLEREDSVDAHERALKSLAAIDDVTPRARAVIDLLKRGLRARIELRQQSAQAQVLQEKLDQIKALEKSLQQHNVPTKTP